MKTILLLFLVLLSINFISSADLDIQLVEHFYKDGVLIANTPDLVPSAISFEVIATNNLADSRILSISITNFSSNFGDSLPKKTIEFLRIKQTTTLFESSIIDISNLTGNQSFSISLAGLNEKKWNLITASTEKIIQLKKDSLVKKDFIYEIGNLIMPSNYKMGAGIGLLIAIVLIFIMWYTSSYQKISQWKQNQRRKKMLKIQQEEYYRRQRG
ncbi:MAG: hypothetical protein WC758_07900 [Candidatus Woesearchaeota archaeon]|jgi:hypothetical protein